MSDTLEQLMLQGAASKGDGYGPERRINGDPSEDSDVSVPNTDDELGSDLSGNEEWGDREFAAKDVHGGTGGSARRGAPSTRTGPKGVIHDRQVQDTIDKAKRQAQVNAINRRLECMALTTNTWEEDEKQRKSDARNRADGANKQAEKPSGENRCGQQASIEELAARERRREQRMNEIKAQVAARSLGGSKVVRGPNTWFGHLREVDARGYVDAIDRTEDGTFVVIHIYSKRIVACTKISAALTSLARQYPQTKFLQVQATKIEFGCSAEENGVSGEWEDDEDEDREESSSRRRLRELEMDEQAADVLPTLLVYQAGQLLYNLVRIDLDDDWGKGEERDIRDALQSRGVLREDNEERYVLYSDEDGSD
ncbi:thioredoxin-like protein, partial [Tilletiaria anomala UBC 951]